MGEPGPSRGSVSRGGPHEASWWTRKGEKILCELCPRACLLADGQAGFCFIRERVGDRLVSTGYGRTTGFAVDPIEKKPLNHFLPGAPILSFGTAGCNLGCRFCQNWETSKARLTDASSLAVAPEQVVEIAESEGCPAIAYTYNDPVIWAEFAVDVAHIARSHGIANVMVTAGYITENARADVYREVDAANVDLKAFTEEFYRRYTLAHIEPVKETLRWLVHETAVWVEITTLLIPGLNDGDDEVRALSEWVAKDLGVDVPLHFTAFHPDFKMTDRPRTPATTLVRARGIARDVGLRYVYVGNVHDIEGSTTRCERCGSALVVRDWHSVVEYNLDGDRCAECGARLPGRFPDGWRPGTLRRPRGLRLI